MKNLSTITLPHPSNEVLIATLAFRVIKSMATTAVNTAAGGLGVSPHLSAATLTSPLAAIFCRGRIRPRLCSGATLDALASA